MIIDVLHTDVHLLKYITFYVNVFYNFIAKIKNCFLFVLFLGYDFNKIDSFIDFYVIDIINFNDCTNEFKCSTYPIDGEGYGTMVL